MVYFSCSGSRTETLLKQDVASPSFLTFSFSSKREHVSLVLHATLTHLIVPLTKYLICNKDQRQCLYFKDRECLIHVHAPTVVPYVCINIDGGGNCCCTQSWIYEWEQAKAWVIYLWHQTSLVHHPTRDCILLICIYSACSRSSINHSIALHVQHLFHLWVLCEIVSKSLLLISLKYIKRREFGKRNASALRITSQPWSKKLVIFTLF